MEWNKDEKGNLSKSSNSFYVSADIKKILNWEYCRNCMNERTKDCNNCNITIEVSKPDNFKEKIKN